MEDRASLTDALARNRGRRILPGWMDKFQEITGQAVQAGDFLDISETRRLKEAFFERVKVLTSCSVREWLGSDFDEVLSYLYRLNEQVGPVDVVLFSDVDSFIGALRVQSTVVLNHAKELKDFLKEDLSFASEDLASGVCFEFNYYSDNGEYSREGYYRLVTWGSYLPWT